METTKYPQTDKQNGISCTIHYSAIKKNATWMSILLTPNTSQHQKHYTNLKKLFILYTIFKCSIILLLLWYYLASSTKPLNKMFR